MTKISDRLKAIALFVSKNDRVVDIGCDHGYLSIYLIKNKLAKKVIASDVNQNALNSAIKNITREKLNIETVLSDGLENINLKDINTLVISGMGTSTILHILEDQYKLKRIEKLIIQSNNDHPLLRQNLNKKGYYLEEEKYIFDKGKWYIICLFIKEDKKNSQDIINYGYLNNQEYNKYILEYEKKLYKKIPFIKIKKKLKQLIKINKLRRTIK